MLIIVTFIFIKHWLSDDYNTTKSQWFWKEVKSNMNQL